MERYDTKTFRDFLTYYNNLDTQPFVQAVILLQEYYRNKNLDVFKIAISVPGISRRLLFEAAERNRARFELFSRDEDLYRIVKQNIIGGPSIIFCSRHKGASISSEWIRTRSIVTALRKRCLVGVIPD